MCLRQILELGKQLKDDTSSRYDDQTWWYVFKTSCRHPYKASWRRFEDVLRTSWRCLEDVLKMSWRRFCKTSWRRLQNVLKTSSEDEWLRWIYSFCSRRLEDVFWRRKRKISSRRLQDVFIKVNACWVGTI